MSKNEFIKLMQDKSQEMSKQQDKISQSGKRKLTVVQKSHTIKKSTIVIQDEVMEDEVDLEIKEEYKGVIKSVCYLFIFSKLELMLRKN